MTQQLHLCETSQDCYIKSVSIQPRFFSITCSIVPDLQILWLVVSVLTGHWHFNRPLLVSLYLEDLGNHQNKRYQILHFIFALYWWMMCWSYNALWKAQASYTAPWNVWGQGAFDIWVRGSFCREEVFEICIHQGKVDTVWDGGLLPWVVILI